MTTPFFPFDGLYFSVRRTLWVLLSVRNITDDDLNTMLKIILILLFPLSVFAQYPDSILVNMPQGYAALYAQYYPFNASIKPKPVTLNLANWKDISCTFLNMQVNLDERNRFTINLKILYLKLISQWEL